MQEEEDFFSHLTTYRMLENVAMTLCTPENSAIQKLSIMPVTSFIIVQELYESRGGRPGLSILTSLLASVDVKIY